VGVEHGTSRVPAGDVVVADEAGFQLPLFVGIPPEITGQDQLFHPRRHIKLIVTGDFLFKITLHGGGFLIKYPVERPVAAHGAIGQAHGGVGIGIESLSGMHLH